MNNLIVLAGREFGLEHALDGAEVTSAALDTANSLLFCTTDDDRLLGISLKGGDPMHEAPVEDVQNIAVLPEVEGVLLVDKHGALSVYHLDSCSFERVGDMAGGLLSTSSSPDGEIVLCLTASYTLIALNMQWGIVFEKQLEQLKIEGVARASVSWSADGMKFVLLLQTEDLSSSYVLVLDRQGNIEAESEVMQDMDDCVAFKTDGSLIAACQRRSGGKQIIFFEPNALRHYEFSLLKEDGQRRVESLCWNSDGSLLAVALRGEEGGGCGKVQLWHRSNYHWYLKQEFLPCTKSSTCCRPWMLWSDDDPNVVVVGFDHQDSNVYTLDWRFDLSPSDSMMLSGSADTSAIDLKTIAMIDGKKLLLTPLGKMLVPPPMAAVTVELPVPISSVCWSPAGDVAVLCSDGSLQILGRPFEGGDSSRWSKVPAVEVEVAGDRTRRIVQLLWLKGRVLLAICCQSSALVPVLLKGGEGESWRMEVGAKIDTSAPVSRLLREEGRNACLVQLEDGQVLEAECAGEQEKITMKSIGKMATTCNKLMIPRGGGKLIIGINKRGKLLVNEEPLAESVTSCCLHDKHLIYTTASCDLVFVPLSFFSSSSSVKSSSSMSMAATNDQRLLERGAQLVTAPLNDQKVVLLLPRGNLEILHPQSLVVHHCCSLLSCSKYLDVLLTMRKHKIDMNLLHDYDPRSFAENVEKIVKEVNSSHLLSLFIAALKEEDVTETMYKYVKDFVPMKQTQQRANMSKVNFVCKLVRDAMEVG
ncbi:hypothetical protein GUITHDRAFT_120499 [Guillardia theta CCMP2712]|uniref:Elongator complex protein 1 n=2 Tax=Guillardia theta TaxID=55529 RepID=L1IAR7_GUITC|nr:hypothetical protein GUITHDRAFT_120499 [Guillardia theta CCMP2712]EKX33336.1 hypothetical protein GUITHDRAFT_120499 [Guillardia theta CCMP2712]|eukprot:XP_005820316.1 hypothetical protein GUITHDRAFT_120499 [Guillardia theta CCMP2712]